MNISRRLRFGQLGQSFGGGDAFWGNAANELPSTLPSGIYTGALVTDVAAGDSHTCALSSDGQLRCWGLGDSGQLGDGNFANQATPPASGVDLDGVTAYRIAAGAAHTCALRRNGTARCWGAGADGRLGRGSGYYDRLLRQLHGTTCGVAFDQQVAEEIPRAPHDAPMNCILTPTRWVEMKA